MDGPEPETETSPSSRPSAERGDVLEERAQLRDLVGELRRATDLAALIGLLNRLHPLLQTHFAREEAQAIRAAAGDGASPDGSEVEALRWEHGEILARLLRLLRRVGSDPTQPVAAVAQEAVAILDRTGWGRAEEGGPFEVELARPLRPSAPRSTGLEVNLRRTAVDVVIPASQRVLLDITADLYGVHENTKRLLREINHRYAGWVQTVEDLHRRAMSDLPYYLERERAPEAIGVFSSLYAKAAEQASPPEAQESAVRHWLQYLEKVVRESRDRLPQMLPAVQESLSRLEALFSHTPRRAVIASSRLRRFVEELWNTLPAGDAVSDQAFELLGFVLGCVYQHWQAAEDPAAWWRDLSGAGPGTPLPEKVEAISHARFQALLERLHDLALEARPLSVRAEELLALPDNAWIERACLEAAFALETEAPERWQKLLGRIRWLIQVLSAENLAPVHERALSEITHAFVEAMQTADRTHLEHLVRETFVALRRSRLSGSAAALQLISKIAVEVVASGDAEWSETVIAEMLDWDFPAPEFSGFTDEWRPRVNPAHLKAIRSYLTVIEQDPELTRSLIAALVVHLKVGGVFIADTDLFQKDVTRLLNSGVRDVYHPIKHLLKLFPVYYNDIGAEGELRDVSTRIDEIGGRRDPLCHFVRKQCHVESNPRLIDLLEAIARFWATGEPEPLRRYVPGSLYEHLEEASGEYVGLHRIFARLSEAGDGSGALRADPSVLEQRIGEMHEERPLDRDKAILLLRLRQLVGQKYELNHDDLLQRLDAFHGVSRGELETLRRALAGERHERALEILLAVLERLKETIVSQERTEGLEDIYHKRHIAVGIPSMYGRYREEKFEAVGLSFRIESLANVLFERMIAETNLEYITRTTLRKVAGWLHSILRALRIDGCHGRGVATGIAMLDQALLAEGISLDQYINMFQVLSRGVEQLIRVRFLDAYELVLERILRRRLERGELAVDPASDAQGTILKVSEQFLRNLIAQSFGLQQLDRLVGQVLRSLMQAREKMDAGSLSVLMSYDADRLTVPIDRRETLLDGAIYLGNKGFLVKRLAQDGFPVPPGFVLTTELFRCRPAILASPELRDDVTAQIRRHVERLEQITGSRFGDPSRPLLLSVRSAAAISMPGILDTFLDVGINAGLAEGLARRSAWGAWDAYRRFLQFWGMGHGLDRDLFDSLMREAKQRFGVEKKSHMPPDQMKQLALRYRSFLQDRGVEIVDEPFEQVLRCVDLVLDSWDSPNSRLYRSELQIAEEWGTAVIVQSMVYGNLHDRSGTGVALTYDPHHKTQELELYGDFVVQAQGDDVVGGLVETFPITEAQRRSERRSAERSLEKDFPVIYQALEQHARRLIEEFDMFHQEIEFTFESDDPGDLYILQTRDTVMSQLASVEAFVPSEALEHARLTTGIGAGGGALSGRVAHTARDIGELRERYPQDPVILMRPDTVPDDIPLIVRADGMVTSLGGATSHAAVAAQRLGKTCVVGCRQLEVRDHEGRSIVAGHSVATGDIISINGIDGSVYLGQHPTTTVQRHSLA